MHFQKKVWKKFFGPKCDVWSLGVVLYQLLSGRLPYLERGSKPAVWLKLLEEPPNWKKLEHCSEHARALCKRMLTYDEDVRPTAAECLQSSWFKEVSRLDHVDFSDDHMNELLTYHEQTDLEKAVRLQIASQLSPAQLSTLNVVFRKHDINNDGTLSPEELTTALQNLGIDEATSMQAAEALDLDGSGEIEYTEFIAGCLTFFEDNMDHLLWSAFKSMDLDKSGMISKEEVHTLLTRGQELGIAHVVPDLQQVSQMLEKIDGNHDGQIDFDEFKSYFISNFKKESRALLKAAGMSGGGKNGTSAKTSSGSVMAEASPS